MPFNSVELVRVSQAGDLDRVRTLVDSGADVNSIGEHGIGPLLTKSAKVMEFLLSRGADPNLQTNESGDPVLVGIAYLNELDCVRLLLQAGANPNALVNGTDETALHAVLAIPKEGAATATQCALVQLLVEHGAEVNRQTRPGVPCLAFWRDVRTRGETPLHRAAAFASEETVRFLIDAGADRTIRDVNGDSPQSWASWHWRPKPLIDLLDPRA